MTNGGYPDGSYRGGAYGGGGGGYAYPPPSPYPGGEPSGTPGGGGMRMAGRILTALGLVLVAGAVVLTVLGVRGVSDGGGRVFGLDVVPAGHERVVPTAAGAVVDVRGDLDQLDAGRPGTCRAGGVPARWIPSTTRGNRTDIDGRGFVDIGKFRVEEAGDLRVTCTVDASVHDPEGAGQLGYGLVQIVWAVICAGSALVLLLPGIILWVIGARRLSAARIRAAS